MTPVTGFQGAPAAADVPVLPARLLPAGRVVGLWGTATVRTPEGLQRALKVGDLVQKGDVIATTQDGIVQIEPDGEPVQPQVRSEATSSEIDRVITDLDQPDNEVAPTAVLDSGNGDGLAAGVRVDRIFEVVGRSEYSFATQQGTPAPFVAPNVSSDSAIAQLAATSSSIAVLESGRPTNLGLAAPADAGVPSTSLLVTVTGVPEVGHVERADGTLVTAGMQISSGELAGLVYVPPADYTAGTPVGEFSYVVSNGSQQSAGGTSIQVTAVNDAPTALAGSLSVAEDAAVLTGSVSATDPDSARADLRFSLDGAAPAGLTFNADGTYRFDAANPAYQSLGAGQSAVVTVPFTVTDDQGASSTSTLTITVTGTNDGPLAVADTAAVAENFTLGVSAAGGVLTNDTDRDAGDTRSVSAVSFGASTGTVGAALAGTYGTLTLNADGSYSYTADSSAAHALGVGQSGNDVFSYTVRDAAGATSTTTLTITVTGTNDAPVAQAASASAASDGAVVSGSVSATDTDANAVLSFALSNAAPPGLTFHSDGSYSFDASNPAYRSLGAGQSEVLTIPYQVTDDQGATSVANLSITITGSNDGPVAVADTGTLAQGFTLNVGPAGGVLVNDTDVDDGDTRTITGVSFGPATGTVGTALTGTYGTLTLNADGSYSYAADSGAARALGAGQSANDVFSYTVRDAAGATSTATLTMTVTGTNDAPVAQGATVAVAEDAAGLSGSVVATDVDANAALSFALNNPAPAGLTFNADGSYSFNAANSAYQSLGVGQSAVLTVPYTVTDDQGATSTANLVITVTGTNDAPVAQAVSFSVAEDAATLSGSVVGTDIDANATLSFALNSAAPAGLAFNTDGSYSFNAANPAYQSLGVGQSAVLTVPYTVTDDQGATSTVNLVITVTGTNDAPVAQAASFSVAEDAAMLSGSVVATDADANATLSFALNNPAPAGLTFNADGSYSFNAANPAYQSLGVGQSAVLTVPYTVTDDQGATSTANLVITVTGTNDAPVAQAASFSVAEDAALLTGSVVATDIDANATLSFALNNSAPAGLTFNADGSYSFNAANPAYQS
ncbi:MAG TPA: Ig-like domain-containing protein, partial [Burkholderiaceae bacterium]|nr:Ig-like domain-containing protein [Burkholderiaceae bacterium]